MMDGLSYDGINTAVIIGAHADDDIIPCGGLLHRMHRDGKQSIVVTVTGGGTGGKSIQMDAQADLVDIREEESKSSDQILGVSERINLRIDSQKVYGSAFGSNDLHHEIIRIIRKYTPDVVFTHYQNIYHQEHRDHDAVGIAVIQAALQTWEDIMLDLGDPCGIPAVLRYGIESEPEPNVFISFAEEDLNAKLKALDSQTSQKRDGYIERWKRKVTARANKWGADYEKVTGKCTNDKYAEAFYIDPARPLIL